MHGYMFLYNLCTLNPGNSIHYPLHTSPNDLAFLFHIQMSNGDLKSSPDDTEPFFPRSFAVFCVIGLIMCHSLR